jgi:hypothetical protein
MSTHTQQDPGPACCPLPNKHYAQAPASVHEHQQLVAVLLSMWLLSGMYCHVQNVCVKRTVSRPGHHALRATPLLCCLD